MRHCGRPLPYNAVLQLSWTRESESGPADRAGLTVAPQRPPNWRLSAELTPGAVGRNTHMASNAKSTACRANPVSNKNRILGPWDIRPITRCTPRRQKESHVRHGGAPQCASGVVKPPAARGSLRACVALLERSEQRSWYRVKRLKRPGGNWILVIVCLLPAQMALHVLHIAISANRGHNFRQHSDLDAITYPCADAFRSHGAPQ